ncbi:hypothetical protein TSUD_175990 [Trifolium subterraneum]|uniref:F-box domain-containing protein n=1 Tax=Trifolium subterraneum TaxID=3900 RepID=A0A2Z6MIY3_TRISU|nr:hypothetical protein TSUD_175990 [Trifolium subterraneum]
MSSTLPLLPPDLITEILSWLPVKILVRFTSVLKHWKSIIFDPKFAKLHLQRSPKHTHVLLTLFDDVKYNGEVYETFWVVAPLLVRGLLEHPSSTVNEDDSFHFDQDHTTDVIGSINGLVCLKENISQKKGIREICIRFWNPSLRLKSKEAPTLTVIPASVNLNLGFGYDDSTDTYKVVAVFWDRTAKKMEGRVHCMGDSCWRKTLACPDFPILLGIGLFVNDSINWLAIDNLKGHKYKWNHVTIKQLVIFSLDMPKETCKYMLLPAGFCELPEYEPDLVVLRGRLCLYYEHKRTHFVLWEMGEFGVQESWTKLVNVSYMHLQFDGFEHYWLLFPVCLSENGDILLLTCKQVAEYVVMYSRRDDRVEHIELPNNEIWYADNEHMQSLVLPLPRPH